MPISKSAKELEQAWIGFQFDIAGIRGTLGPMYQVSIDARRAHTFYVGSEPEGVLLRAVMGPTPGEPNGIPDGNSQMSGGTYGARAASVAAAEVIIMTLNGAIQKFAIDLGGGQGANINAGDFIFDKTGTKKERASTLVWAASNNIRHVDEWYRYADAYKAPTSKKDNDRRTQQNQSMEPLANVLGCALPITDNIAFEVLQLLTEFEQDKGSFDRLELHVLRIGQDLIQQAGLTPAPIGVTILGTASPADIAKFSPEDVTISDGIGRTASSLPDTERIVNLKPTTEPPPEPN